MTAPAVSSGHYNQLDPVVNDDLRSDEALAYPPVDVQKKLLNRPFPFAACGTAILQDVCPISRPSGYSDENACLWNAKADPFQGMSRLGMSPAGSPCATALGGWPISFARQRRASRSGRRISTGSVRGVERREFECPISPLR